MALDEYTSALVTGASSGIGAAIKNTGISELTAEDIADAVLYAVDALWRVNVSLIELQPTEQVFGGMNIAPAD